MDKKPLVFAAVLALGAAFAVVSLLVWLSRGNSKLVAKKLRLGALLIGLTATTAYSSCASCYDVAAQDVVVFTDAAGAELDWREPIRVSSVGEAVITGRIEFRTIQDFSFRVVDPSGTELRSGSVKATDGAFDEGTEEVFLRFDATGLEPGDYELEVMGGKGYGASHALRVVSPNFVTLNDEAGAPLALGSALRVSSAGEAVVTGRVEFRSAEAFSFRVAPLRGSALLSGPIEAADGAFDQKTEELKFRFDASTLETGDYVLAVMSGDGSSESDTLVQYRLQVD